ncbi:hypothetical protein Poly30_36470 [Planctomycetes bacterium Poly30]|uniref:Uncharacterized protein n=1 Tax=Saltatorellus ferox TaxID=2528018 RepID=A0A518EVK5_9BACT|nr:hypothetical protein Poly30_36470 [Planctomycetes bacterium Poly30]
MEGESEFKITTETYTSPGCLVIGCFGGLIGLYVLVEFVLYFRGL